MRLFYIEGEVNYDKVTENTTVGELLEAIDDFLEGNPLNCVECRDSCCKKPWSVGIDNVCAINLCNGNYRAIEGFVNNNLVKKKNLNKDFLQFVLDKKTKCPFLEDSNKCGIYVDRPIICRLYICGNISMRYNALREIVGSTYLKALVQEYRINSNSLTPRMIKKYKRNPVLYSNNYNTKLKDILLYAEKECWLEDDEIKLIHQIMENK